MKTLNSYSDIKTNVQKENILQRYSYNKENAKKFVC